MDPLGLVVKQARDEVQTIDGLNFFHTEISVSEKMDGFYEHGVVF